jgi:hypothetical protein
MSKRQKELARQEKVKEKDAKREQRKREKSERGPNEDGVDPDIAGIVPGPQPLRMARSDKGFNSGQQLLNLKSVMPS